MAYITRIINVLYLISLDSWILFFMLYVISISSDFKSKKLYKIFWVVYVLIAFLISILPINYYYKNNIMYTSGLAVNFTYLIAIIAILVIVINSVINIKKLGNKYNLTIYYLNTEKFFDDELNDYTEDGKKFINSADYYKKQGGYGTPNTIIVQNGVIVDGVYQYVEEASLLKLFKDNGFINE